jgi:hypothetical protein
MLKKTNLIISIIAIIGLLALSSCEKELYDEALKKDGDLKIWNANLKDLPFLKENINNKIK